MPRGRLYDKPRKLSPHPLFKIGADEPVVPVHLVVGHRVEHEGQEAISAIFERNVLPKIFPPDLFRPHLIQSRKS